MANNVPTSLTFGELAGSNMPSGAKSAIQRWFNSSSGPGGDGSASKLARAKLHAKAAGESLRSGGESVIVGAGLGALHASLETGLDYKKVPIDAAAGAVLMVAGVALATEEYGKDLSNAGAAALTVFAFRKGNDAMLDYQLKKSGATPGGGADRWTPNKIGKASFAGEADGWAPGSRPWGRPTMSASMGVDPIIAASSRL
jgi:hypothetical protein